MHYGLLWPGILQKRERERKVRKTHTLYNIQRCWWCCKSYQNNQNHPSSCRWHINKKKYVGNFPMTRGPTGPTFFRKRFIGELGNSLQHRNQGPECGLQAEQGEDCLAVCSLMNALAWTLCPLGLIGTMPCHVLDWWSNYSLGWLVWCFVDEKVAVPFIVEVASAVVCLTLVTRCMPSVRIFEGAQRLLKHSLLKMATATQTRASFHFCLLLNYGYL